jgi:glycosyltransferase involved in cell wall biosynthesis
MKKISDIIMVGFYVEPDYFARYSHNDPFPQIAAHKLEGRYVEGLVRAGLKVDTIASAAITTFPGSRHLFLPGMRWDQGNGKRSVLPLLNVPLLKLLTRFVLTFFTLLRRLRGGASTAICVYSTHSPLLLAAFLASKLRGAGFFVIIPDLPQYMHLPKKSNPLFMAAKKLDGYLVSKLVARAAGASVVTKNIVVDTPAWAHLPYLVIEGLSSAAVEPPAAPSAGARERPYFLYAGGLTESYGVRALIDGFCDTGIDADLLLCGRGELEEFIKARARDDQRVKYCGFLGVAELTRLQDHARALVITRDPAQPYTRYSFPSKLIEYMASGAPVLSTRLAGIPEEYFHFLHVIEKADATSIGAALEAFLAQPGEAVAARASSAREFVLRRCSPDAIMRSFVAFMESAA